MTVNLGYKKPLVYFIGLSAKPNCDHLSAYTNTGYIVEQIINGLPYITCLKTNLVRTPPLDEKGNLRYPDLGEMEQGWKELQKEMKRMYPALLVTLGQQVSFFLRSRMGVKPAQPRLPADFSSKTYLSQSESHLLSVHHPSFVFVYRRKYVENYVNNVVESISSLIL